MYDRSRDRIYPFDFQYFCSSVKRIICKTFGILCHYHRDKMPLVTLLKPVLWQLRIHLEIKESDSDIVKTFKESLSNVLHDCYEGPDIKWFLQIATTFDSKFKEMPYVTEEGTIDTCVKVIQDEFVKTYNKAESSRRGKIRFFF